MVISVFVEMRKLASVAMGTSFVNNGSGPGDQYLLDIEVGNSEIDSGFN